MKLDAHSAPHIRSSTSNRTVMGDAVVTLGAIYTMTYFYYGQRALALGLVSVFTCFFCETLCNWLRRRRMNVMDFSSIVTGLLIPLLMPATVSYRIVIATGIFAICVVKQPFGGTGSNPFNPAAGGLAFAIVCWSKELFAYPMPFSTIPVTGEITTTLYSSASYTLYVGGVPQLDPAKMILGLFPGPMGTTNLLVLLACLLYLVLRRTVRVQQPLLMLLTVAAIAWFFPRTSAEPIGSVFFELAAVPTLFFTAFLFSDPVTTPARGVAKAAYAILSGVMLMGFRYMGGYEFTAPFAVLAMNTLTPVFDIVAENINTAGRRLAFGTAKLEDQPDFDTEEDSED